METYTIKAARRNESKKEEQGDGERERETDRERDKKPANFIRFTFRRIVVCHTTIKRDREKERE